MSFLAVLRPSLPLIAPALDDQTGIPNYCKAWKRRGSGLNR